MENLNRDIDSLIGELLLKYTNVTKAQINEALEIQKDGHQLLGDILVKKNYIKAAELVNVLCAQLNIPIIRSIDTKTIDTRLIQDIPINYLKTNQVLPIEETPFFISVLMADPFNNEAINDLVEKFNKEISISVASPKIIQDAINNIFEKIDRHVVDSLEDEFSEDLDLDAPIDILDADDDEAPVIKFVHSVIFKAVKEKAGDIHIEPYERETIYRFRVNGIMTEVLRQPIKTHAAVVSRIKVMAKIDIAEKRLPQDGRIKIKIAGKDIDIRLSTVPVQYGERVVMRILEKGNIIHDLPTLGFSGKVLDNLYALTERKHGVVYVTGPTGHGKTTTLFAMLSRMNNPDRMIITVEDPVEYELPGVSQIQVNHRINLSFARALRSILRQNPDIIMVGETRDFETAEMAIQSSLTGHLVLSTLHTNDASSAPTRLIDMGVQPFLIASSLEAVLAQRLLRTLCPKCKKEKTVTSVELKLLERSSIPDGVKIYEAVGCMDCNYTGYSNRTSIYELMMITDPIKQLIMQKADAGQLRKKAISLGMTTLRESAMEKLFAGITSIEALLDAVNAGDDD